MSDNFFIAFALFVFTAIGAYVTHLIWAFKVLTSEASAPVNQVVLSVFGTVLPPLGAIHGFTLWFS